MSDTPAPTGASILNQALNEITTPPGEPSTPPATPPTDQPDAGTSAPPATETQTPPAPDAGGDNRDNIGPDHPRFKEVTAENRKLREQVAEYERQQEAARVAQLSEAERLKEEKEAAEREAAAAKQRAEKLERDSWILGMAAALNFADPADAVALVDPKACADKAAAQAAVKQLADAKPHLLGKGGQPRSMGTPGGGQQTPPAGGAGDSDDPKVQTGKDLLNFLNRGR